MIPDNRDTIPAIEIHPLALHNPVLKEHKFYFTRYLVIPINATSTSIGVVFLITTL
jgi:hypothetical protein